MARGSRHRCRARLQTSRVKLIPTGLGTQASISIDRWGICHIRAANKHDLFFAQGFNAARDRLWQIDLWRKRGLGLLAADFGSGHLEQDRAARLAVLTMAETVIREIGAALCTGHILSAIYFQTVEGAANERFVKAIKGRFGQDTTTSVCSQAAYMQV